MRADTSLELESDGRCPPLWFKTSALLVRDLPTNWFGPHDFPAPNSRRRSLPKGAADEYDAAMMKRKTHCKRLHPESANIVVISKI